MLRPDELLSDGFYIAEVVPPTNERIFRSTSPDGVRRECWAHLAVRYATMCVQVDAADHAKWDPDRISRKNTVRVIRSREWRPESFPSPTITIIILATCDQGKMSNVPFTRVHHRQRRQVGRPPRSAVIITPPSRLAYSKGPARTS